MAAKKSIYRATDSSIARKKEKPKRPMSGAEASRLAEGNQSTSSKPKMKATGGLVYDSRNFGTEPKKYVDLFPGKNDAKKRGR